MDWSQVEKNENILNEKVYVLYLGKKTSSSNLGQCPCCLGSSELEISMVKATAIFSPLSW